MGWSHKDWDRLLKMKCRNTIVCLPLSKLRYTNQPKLSSIEEHNFEKLCVFLCFQAQQSVVDTPLSEELPINKASDMTLQKLTVWLYDCRPRLQVLAGLVYNCDSKRGGNLCSVVHKYSQTGDPLRKDLTVSLLSTVCKPLYITLSQWILYGELEDPYNEFFIAGDPSCTREHLWHFKYKIR